MLYKTHLSLGDVHGEVGVEDVLQLGKGQATHFTAPAIIKILHAKSEAKVRITRAQNLNFATFYYDFPLVIRF
jgi:hypothetical protein